MGLADKFRAAMSKKKASSGGGKTNKWIDGAKKASIPAGETKSKVSYGDSVQKVAKKMTYGDS